MTETLAANRPMTVEEVAEFLGVPENTVRHWRYLSLAGQPTGPRSFKIGRYVRYDPRDVQDWLDRRRAGLV